MKEIQVLKTQIEHHPLVSKHSLEVQRLKTTIKTLREDTGIMVNMQNDQETIKKLDEEYEKLIAEGDKPGNVFY